MRYRGRLANHALDPGMFVGGVVVDDEMDVEGLGHVGVDVAQEGEELLVSMATFALREHLAGGHVQGGEQGCGAVADIIVRHPLDVTRAPWAASAGYAEGPGFGFFHPRTAPRHGRGGSDTVRRCRGLSR